MKYSELFADSAARHPNGGARLSPTACGFILTELEGLVENYKEELADPAMLGLVRGITEYHLEGLETIVALIQEGWTNKPQ